MRLSHGLTAVAALLIAGGVAQGQSPGAARSVLDRLPAADAAGERLRREVPVLPSGGVLNALSMGIGCPPNRSITIQMPTPTRREMLGKIGRFVVGSADPTEPLAELVAEQAYRCAAARAEAFVARSGVGRELVRRTSSVLGAPSAATLSRSAGTLAGGTAAGAVLIYAEALLGYTDWTTAHKNMVGLTAGVGAGALAAAGVGSLVAAVGVAGTGAAISGLSGAAATSATLAWLGGGSLAAGGWGVAGGTVVLGTATAGVGVVIAGVVGYGFYLSDEADEANRVRGECERLRQRSSFVDEHTEEGRRLLRRFARVTP